MKRIVLLVLIGLLSLSVQAARHKRLTRDQKRVLYASPRAITGNFGLGAVGGYAAASIGLEYEQFIHPTSFLSATVKVSAFLGGHLGTGPLREGDVWSQNYGYYAAPGIRFHPLRNWHSVDVGVGAAAALGYGRRRDQFSYNYYTGGAWTVERNFFGAMQGEITVNFLEPHWHGIQSVFVCGGYIYSNAKARYYVRQNGEIANSENDPVYLQVGFRLGGRW